ncbi:HABP4_PAI-RBP1 domain-containing protein [Nephila pilipes]|uniref:HABP4_PAI-RBP1 domain-containing protein n=1 Tax=Nephila pilipes TaxID=299642 RepID=A0A8X6M9H2_NEPPI|nr:HABP4_PAI-RBP1 domain-containing protein [Nephila pilipes]
MENAYGIGVKNRYELFYDEDVDPFEIIRQREEEKEKRKTEKTHPKDKNKTTKTGKTNSATPLSKKIKDTQSVNSPKPTETTETSNKSRPRPFTDRNAKNTRSFDESKKTEERKNFRNREEHGPTSENRERDPDMRRGRGGFRGRGRPRGRGGFFNYDNRPPRREFDRHSGSDKSGMRAVEKRDGAGSNNWGDMKNEFNPRKKESDSTWIDDEFDASGDKQNDSTWNESLAVSNISSSGKDDATGEKSGDDLLTEHVESKENLPVSEERTEESIREMTLDEWKREQEAKRAVPKYNLRKPGEGEDGNRWKKLYVLKKKVKEEDDEEDDDDDDTDEDEYARRGRQRQLVDIQINFNDSRRGRGRGRGTRGIGPRNDRGSTSGKDINREDRRETVTAPGGRSYRGSMKINKSGQQSAPRVDDWNDFPSLVTA